MEKKCELLRKALSALPPAELDDFIDRFDEADAGAYTWAMWGAAYLLNGGCSDDSFDDFRATLISMGRSVYEEALRDPETLADVPYDRENPCFEGYQYAHQEIAARILGKVPHRRIPFPDEPTGQPWEEDRVAELFPVLAAMNPRANGAPHSKLWKPWWKLSGR